MTEKITLKIGTKPAQKIKYLSKWVADNFPNGLLLEDADTGDKLLVIYITSDTPKQSQDPDDYCGAV